MANGSTLLNLSGAVGYCQLSWLSDIETEHIKVGSTNMATLEDSGMMYSSWPLPVPVRSSRAHE